MEMHQSVDGSARATDDPEEPTLASTSIGDIFDCKQLPINMDSLVAVEAEYELNEQDRLHVDQRLCVLPEAIRAGVGKAAESARKVRDAQKEQLTRLEKKRNAVLGNNDGPHGGTEGAATGAVSGGTSPTAPEGPRGAFRIICLLAGGRMAYPVTRLGHAVWGLPCEQTKDDGRE